MNKIYRALNLLLLSVFFFQCQKPVNYYGSPDTGGSTLPDPIKTTVQGNITDENNQPAAGVSITAGTKTAITNTTGYFRITDAVLDKNTAMITATKPGYFKGLRIFSATSGTNQVAIKLIKKDLAGTVSASAGGTATLTNGAKVNLPANGIVTASSNASYSGDVNVYVAYINPKSGDISKTIPGSFAATDKDGKRVILNSYGMLAVELESPSGEKLQIKEGAVATLTSPISSNAANAPATIPLWYVDEQTGLWKEEGTAAKQGNNYVGTVKHFTFWNCDYPFPAGSISMTLENAGGKPLVYAQVRITANLNNDSSGAAYGTTDSLGKVTGLVPANTGLTVDVMDPCGQSIFSKDVSSVPVNGSKDLGILTITTSTQSQITLKGILKDCSGVAVTNGHALISVDNIVRYAETAADGTFSVDFTTCSGIPVSAQILGIDEDAQQQSAIATIPITSPLTNAGSIIACGVSSLQYVNYTLDGTDYSITSAAGDSLYAFVQTQGGTNTIYFSSSKQNNSEYLNFTLRNVFTTGTFPVASLLVQPYETVLKDPFNVTLTAFANAPGEFYEGSLEGTFTAISDSSVHHISANFKIRRNQ